MMFSTYNNNDHDQKRNDNNDCPEIAESAALILSSQYIDNNNRNFSYFNPSNNANNANPIFIQPDQIETFSTNDSVGHEHLMILAAAAVNSSPSNDSCKSSGNINESTIIGTSDSPHFSIHDPPLIRLSPTSPNNLFRPIRFNDDFTGIANVAHNNSGFSSNNFDWLSQELYVKTENGPGELTHSSLKRQTFTNSLSDTEYPSGRTRGRSHLRSTESRDNDHAQNSPSQRRPPRKDLKRKRLYRPENSEYDTIMSGQYNATNNVDDLNVSTNFNTSSFINLTESDGESQLEDNRTNITDRLTPELSRRQYRQWWPIKRHRPDRNNDDRIMRRDLPENTDNDSPPQQPQFTSSTDTTSPGYEAGHRATSQFSPCSPPFFMLPDNNADTYVHYPDNIVNNAQTGNSDAFNNQHRQPISGRQTFPENPVEYQVGDHITNSTDVSSCLRRILGSQLYNRRRYAVSNLPPSLRDLSRYYLPQYPTRPFSYRVPPQSTQNYYSRTSSTDRFVTQTGLYDQDSHNLSANQVPSARSTRVNAHIDSPTEDPSLLTNLSYSRNSIPSTMNTFLRAYGLEEVQQRQIEEPYSLLRDPRLQNDSVRMHPLLRSSERNYLNPMSDSRSGPQFSRPFAMFESQGSVESVIQLALHLETSWSGISPEELYRLPCHYYSHVNVETTNHSDKQDKCMVCLDEFVDNDQLRTLSCGHQYHVNCVDKWLKMNRTCPMCRSDAVLGSSSYLYVN